MEQTLTITKEPLKTARLARKADLTIILKGVLTNDIVYRHLKIETDQQVHAFILEGVGAVQRWLDMIGTEDASTFGQDITKVEQDLEWCKPFISEKPSSRTSSTTSSTSSIPIKKTIRKSPVSSTQTKTTVRNTTSVKTRTPVQTTSDTKSRIATALPKKIPKPTTATNTTRTSASGNTKPPTTTTKTKTVTRKPDTGATSGIKSSLTKKIPASRIGGVSKTTPSAAAATPASVIPGRTRKTNHVDNKKDTVDHGIQKKKISTKKEVSASKVPRVNEEKEDVKIKTEPSEVEVQDTVITPQAAEEEVREEKKQEEEQEKEEEEEVQTNEVVVEEEEEVIVEEEEQQEEKENEPVESPPIAEKVQEEEDDEETNLSKVDEGVVLDELPQEKEEEEEEQKESIRLVERSISHVSSGSSAATDEHDAEVAAAVSSSDPNNNNTIKKTFNNNNGGGYFDRLPRSYSPFIASSARPATPEVDQLRQRFETIIQTPTENNKPPAKISPEFVSRIKEMKPRGPAGSRVKSMVDLFMDENLNKWEF